MKKLRFLLILLSLLFTAFGIISCGNGDDSPCNGAQNVYYASKNRLFNALNQDSNQYFLFTDLADSSLIGDTIKLEINIDTPFIYQDYRSARDCYNCGAEVETYVAEISNMPSKNNIPLEYDECLGYRMRIGQWYATISEYTLYELRSTDYEIKLNDTFGIDYITDFKNFKIERIK